MKKIIHLSPKLLISMAMLLATSITIAQKTVIPVINQKQEHVLKSSINGTTYYLSVSLPMHYSKMDTTHYPVLYMLDGGLAFPIAHASRTSLDLFGDLEDLIIVTIEYKWEQSLIPWMTTRWKEYTPSKDEKMDANPGYLKMFDLQPGALTSGGGPVFLNVIKKDIIPFIDKQYKTTNDRGISGHSLGGLFAGYCLLTSPGLFQRYGINSPSFWWNNKEIFNVEKAFSEKNTSLPVKIFMSVGSLEGSSMTPVMSAFADSLRSRNYKGLNLTSHIFEDENHMSVVPAMISRTLRVLYGKKKD
ncbi:MAG: alpha/beta hydrolase-fold protein [Ferruginibacter sp.]